MVFFRTHIINNIHGIFFSPWNFLININWLILTTLLQGSLQSLFSRDGNESQKSKDKILPRQYFDHFKSISKQSFPGFLLYLKCLLLFFCYQKVSAKEMNPRVLAGKPSLNCTIASHTSNLLCTKAVWLHGACSTSRYFRTIQMLTAHCTQTNNFYILGRLQGCAK